VPWNSTGQLRTRRWTPPPPLFSLRRDGGRYTGFFFLFPLFFFFPLFSFLVPARDRSRATERLRANLLQFPGRADILLSSPLFPPFLYTGFGKIVELVCWPFPPLSPSLPSASPSTMERTLAGGSLLPVVSSMAQQPFLFSFFFFPFFFSSLRR